MGEWMYPRRFISPDQARDAIGILTGARWLIRAAKARNRRDDRVEGILRSPPVGYRVGQRADDLELFKY